jgi:predicted nucleotidyltransferase
MNPLSPTIADMHARRERRKRALTDQLARLVDQPARMGALWVIVFGSFAEDAGRSTSDLDLIVVMPPEKTGKEWRRIVGTELDREISCDLLVYTEEELVRMIPVSRFVRHALETGKTVYEKRPET